MSKYLQLNKMSQIIEYTVVSELLIRLTEVLVG